MDIRIAEKQITKLLDYLQEVSTQSTTMYSKSKRRLQRIAVTCNQVVKVISSMLEDEILECDVDMGGMKDTDVILQSIQSMQQSVDQLNYFISNRVQSSITEDIQQSMAVTKPSYVPPDFKVLSASECAQIVRKYSQVSQAARLKYTGQNLKIINLLDILYTWIKLRFTNKHPKFKYNVYMLPCWIYSIVILYGHHVESNTDEDYLYYFYRWCDSLADDTSTYPVPYEVNQFMQDSSRHSDTLTLTSLVLWDILLDLGWRECCSIDDTDAYLSEIELYRRAQVYAPRLLDVYCNYKQDDTILQTCKLA